MPEEQTRDRAGQGSHSAELSIFRHMRAGPRTCDVRVKIGAKDLTSSLCSFQFYANSCASCCLAVGPGLLSDGAPGVPTSFFIEARNAQNGKRTTGGDTFLVKAFILPEESRTASRTHLLTTLTSAINAQCVQNGAWLKRIMELLSL